MSNNAESEPIALVFSGDFRGDRVGGAYLWSVVDQYGEIWRRGVDYDYRFAERVCHEQAAEWQNMYGGYDPHVLYRGLMSKVLKAPRWLYDQALAIAA